MVYGITILLSHLNEAKILRLQQISRYIHSRLNRITSMDAAGLGLGIVAAVVELYKVIEGAYALCHEIKQFSTSYHELYLCMEIERWRFKLWGQHTLSEGHLEEAKTSASELKLFELFELILQKIHDTFSESGHVMGKYGEHVPSENKNGEVEGPHLEVDTGEKSIQTGDVKRITY